MSWNSGGNPGNPWGSPGGNPPPGGGGRGPERGPWGPRGPGGGGGPGIPDFDEVIRRLQRGARRFTPGGRGGPGGNARLFLLIGAVAVAIWLLSGFYRVQPDEQGVVLRFGAFQGYTYPGLRYHLPWPIEEALTPSVTRVNRIEVGIRSADRLDRGEPGREVPAEALMLTGDENIIDINFSVFWRIKDAKEFLFNTQPPRRHRPRRLREHDAPGHRPHPDPAGADRGARADRSRRHAGVQAILDQYGTGVEVTQVQLQKVDPPNAVIESFRDVQRANTDAERIRNEAESYRNDIVPRARGDAARILAEAQGQKTGGGGGSHRPGPALPQRLQGLCRGQGHHPRAALHRHHGPDPEGNAVDRAGRPAPRRPALLAAGRIGGEPPAATPTTTARSK